MLPQILALYVAEGSVIADVTFGGGAFWRKVDLSKFTLLKSDLQDGIDCRSLPYGDRSVNALVVDLPYMHDGATVHPSLKKRYRNEKNGSHSSVIRLYAGAILEATRVLKRKGVIIVKIQDEIESGKQKLSHVELIDLLTTLGFDILDIFVLIRTGLPLMRQSDQKHARKNHSFAIVARFRR